MLSGILVPQLASQTVTVAAAKAEFAFEDGRESELK